MAHEQTYRDDDPRLADLRRVCLSLPEAVEVMAWGRPTFRAGKKMFAVYIEDPADRHAVTFIPDPDERLALEADHRFFSPRYFGPGGWLALDLTAAPVDWAEVGELVESSYRQVALKRMIQALDGR